MLQRHCCLNNAPTKLMRGDYVAVCIYQFPLFISDKNKHEVSDQTYNCPHNSSGTITSSISCAWCTRAASVVGSNTSTTRAALTLGLDVSATGPAVLRFRPRFHILSSSAAFFSARFDLASTTSSKLITFAFPKIVNRVYVAS